MNADDICVVGIMERPIYKLNDQNKILKIMCKPEDFKTIILSNPNINENDVTLDIVMEPAKVSDNSNVYTYDKIKEIKSSIWSESDLSEFNFQIIKSAIDVPNYNIWTHKQWWFDCKFFLRPSGDQYNTFYNVSLNDQITFPIASSIAINGMAGLYSVYQAIKSYELGMNKIDFKSPLSLKITKSGSIGNPCMKIITTRASKLLKTQLGNELLDTKILRVECEYANQSYMTRTPVTLRELQDSNMLMIGFSIDMTMIGDYPIIFELSELIDIGDFKRIKYMGIVFNSYKLGYDRDFGNYRVIVDVEHIDDKTIKFSIPASVFKHQCLYGATNTEILLESIFDDGVFTTEKPSNS